MGARFGNGARSLGGGAYHALRYEKWMLTKLCQGRRYSAPATTSPAARSGAKRTGRCSSRAWRARSGSICAIELSVTIRHQASDANELAIAVRIEADIS